MVGNAKESKCNASSQSATFLWTVVPSVALSTTTTTSALTVPANTLTGGSRYVFTLTLTLNSLSNSIDYIVTVTRSPLVAVISGADSTSWATSKNNTLDASLSYDPDDRNVNLTFLWRCDRSGTLCYDSSQSVKRRLKLDPVATIVIPGGTLIDGLYSFTVDVRSADGRTSSKYVHRLLVLREPPKMEISPSRTQVTSTKKLKLKG
eukprot:776_1